MDSFVYDKMIEKYPDARRVAPISACVSSSTKYYQQTLALMGATRLASGHFQQPRLASGHFSATSERLAPISAFFLMNDLSFGFNKGGLKAQ